MGIYKRRICKIFSNVLVCMFIVRLISSVVFSGIICKIAADKLAGTGALSSYTLGQQNDPEMED